MFTHALYVHQKNVLYVCGGGYHVYSRIICSPEEVCYMYVWGLPCLPTHYMFTRRSVLYVCGGGYHVYSCIICSPEEVCCMYVVGVTMLSKVLYVHKKKCVVCV